MVPVGVVYVDIAEVLQNCEDLQSLNKTIHEFSVLSLAKEQIGSFEMIITAESDQDERLYVQAKRNLSNSSINYSELWHSPTNSNNETVHFSISSTEKSSLNLSLKEKEK